MMQPVHLALRGRLSGYSRPGTAPSLGVRPVDAHAASLVPSFAHWSGSSVISRSSRIARPG
jgi:hypothetical protein